MILFPFCACVWLTKIKSDTEAHFNTSRFILEINILELWHQLHSVFVYIKLMAKISKDILQLCYLVEFLSSFSLV